MSKFKSSSRKRDLFRSSTGSSIRGKISGPIPFKAEDDEFPMRHPGASIATPVKEDEIIFPAVQDVIPEVPNSKELDEEKSPLDDVLEEKSPETSPESELDVQSAELAPPVPLQPPPDIPAPEVVPTESIPAEEAEETEHTDKVAPSVISSAPQEGSLAEPLELPVSTPAPAETAPEPIESTYQEDPKPNPEPSTITVPQTPVRQGTLDIPLTAPLPVREHQKQRYGGSSASQPSLRESPDTAVKRPVTQIIFPADDPNRDSVTTEATDKPQRKKSTFSKVFGRLFGKKRKAVSASPTSRKPLKSGQRDSDTPALNDHPLRPQRSNSLPINELSRALHSHSPFAEPFPPEETVKQRESVVSTTRPRGATTPSRLYTGRAVSGFTGLSPRPVSGYGRSSHVQTSDDEAPIGYAVTSGSHPHRRSRSLGQLRQSEKTSTDARRRSDEIRYWRESYGPDPLSPLSSNRPETAPEGPDPGFPLPESQEAEQLPPQPFNFGPLGEMAGMKITQAATFESRVSTVEERVMNLERRFLHISARSSLRNPGEVSLPSQRPLQSGTSFSYPIATTPRSYRALGDAPSSSTLADPSPNPDLPPYGSSSADTTRPTSTGTAIHMPPSNYLRKSGGDVPAFTLEHYNTLMSLLASEQDARRLLEEQVRILQKEIHSLRLQIPHLTGGRFEYTPSPHSMRGSPPAPPPHREFSSFDHSSDSDESDFEASSNYGAVTGIDVPQSYANFNNRNNNNITTSSISTSAYLPNNESEDVFQTPFQTPLEERSGAYEAYINSATANEELASLASRRDKDLSDIDVVDSQRVNGKDTSRTMSLSQLTLGRGRAAGAK